MGSVYPLIEKLLTAIKHRGIKNRLFACYGSFTWAGAAVKQLTSFTQAMNWELIGNPVENKQAVLTESYQAAFELGQAMAKKLQQDSE
jgi:flavorubredoxin